MKTKITIILVLILFNSCASRKAQVIDLKRFEDGKGGYYVTFDATRRGSFIYTDYNTGTIKMLSEVSPDVVVSSITDLTSKLKIKDDFNAEQVTKITESITQLGKRTVAVNILRDALYRLEELNMNKTNLDDNSFQLFKLILESAVDIAKAEIEDSKNKNLELEKSIESLRLEYQNLITN